MDYHTIVHILKQPAMELKVKTYLQMNLHKGKTKESEQYSFIFNLDFISTFSLRFALLNGNAHLLSHNNAEFSLLC